MSDKQDSAIVIRYSKEVMIGLHDSPLVQKPESMPSLLTWFGEDPNSPASKNLLNGVIMTRAPNDKSIILGPTKTNFASSLYGGLKRTDDNISKAQQASNSTRHNHRQLDERSNSNNNTGLKEYRSPRGPSFMGEKGFSHNKPSDRKFMGSSPPNKRNERYNDRINDNTKNNGRNLHNNRNNRHNNVGTSNYHDLDTSERVPEWMDYTPETEVDKEEEDVQAQFANDLEAWKSNMKKREGIQETVSAKKPVEESLATLSVTEPIKPQDPLAFFEEATSPEQRRDQKGGSRFAKFFAKREEPTIEPVNQEQPKSISLNDLFQQGPTQQSSASAQPTYNPQQQPRVFSEEDILKSLGAKKTVHEPAKSNNQTNEDAMGFNRVLQILSQPKPTLNETVIEEKASPKLHTSNKGSPMMTGSPASNPDNKPASSAARFGNNLPTSVLRQMSARSSEGRSPSLQSAKSTPPTTHTTASTNMRYSPAMKQHLPPHLQQQQLPNGIPLPPQQYFAYQQQQQQQQPYSPGHPIMDHRTFEQLIQFNNGTGMPPPPPHLRNTNGANGEFLPPHMMMHPPLPPGQRPMMTPPPPHHFTQQQLQQLMQQQQQQQGRFPMQQQQQQQRDMMPPMPPHVMANGIPPQLFNKNQGWERQ